MSTHVECKRFLRTTPVVPTSARVTDLEHLSRSRLCLVLLPDRVHRLQMSTSANNRNMRNDLLETKLALLLILSELLPLLLLLLLLSLLSLLSNEHLRPCATVPLTMLQVYTCPLLHRVKVSVSETSNTSPNGLYRCTLPLPVVRVTAPNVPLVAGELVNLVIPLTQYCMCTVRLLTSASKGLELLLLLDESRSVRILRTYSCRPLYVSVQLSDRRVPFVTVRMAPTNLAQL